MNWYKESVRMRGFTIEEALRILELKPGASEIEIKSARNRLAKLYHTDVGGDHEKMSEVNVAYEFLKSKGFDSNSARDVWPSPGARWKSTYKSEGMPPWQTDFRSTNQFGKDYNDMNFCKKAIYEESIKNSDDIKEFTLWAWDGSFFRSTMTVNTNEDTFDFAGIVMEKWSSGLNGQIVAVFCNQKYSKGLRLLRLYGKNVFKEKNIIETHDSVNDNPGNDISFNVEMRKKYPEK
jgi:hypothetical protein